MSEASPLVSVIVPVFNSAARLHASLGSIRSQSLTNFECICVDDGSVDGSSAFLDEWAKSDSRFYVVHKPNGGVSSARNEGVALAGGKYLYFMDSDDMVHPDLLLTCTRLLDAHAADFIFFDYRRISDDEARSWGWGNLREAPVKVIRHPVEFCSRECGLQRCGVVQMMFRRDKWGLLRFDENLHHGEDTLAFYSFLRDATTGLWLKTAPYLYIQHDDSLTHCGKIKTPERNRIRLMETLARHYSSKPKLFRVLRRTILASMIRKPLKILLRRGKVPRTFLALMALAFEKRLVLWTDFTPAWQFRIFMMLKFRWGVEKESCP